LHQTRNKTGQKKGDPDVIKYHGEVAGWLNKGAWYRGLAGISILLAANCLQILPGIKHILLNGVSNAGSIAPQQGMHHIIVGIIQFFCEAFVVE